MNAIDTKSLSSVILAKMGGDEPQSEPQEEGNPGLDSASEELLSALNEKSPQAITRALKNFVQMCEDDDGPEAA